MFEPNLALTTVVGNLTPKLGKTANEQDDVSTFTLKVPITTRAFDDEFVVEKVELVEGKVKLGDRADRTFRIYVRQAVQGTCNSGGTATIEAPLGTLLYGDYKVEVYCAGKGENWILTYNWRIFADTYGGG